MIGEGKQVEILSDRCTTVIVIPLFIDCQFQVKISAQAPDDLVVVSVDSISSTASVCLILSLPHLTLPP